MEYLEPVALLNMILLFVAINFFSLRHANKYFRTISQHKRCSTYKLNWGSILKCIKYISLISRDLHIVCDQFTKALHVIVPKHQPNKLRKTNPSESQAVLFPFHTSSLVVKIPKAKLNLKIIIGHPTVF